MRFWIYSTRFSFNLNWIPLYGWSVAFQIMRADLAPGSLDLTSLNSSHFELSFPWLLFILYSSTCNSDLYLISQQLGNCPQLLTGSQYWLINILCCYSRSLDKRRRSFRERSCLLSVPPLHHCPLLHFGVCCTILCSSIALNYTRLGILF